MKPIETQEQKKEKEGNDAAVTYCSAVILASAVVAMGDIGLSAAIGKPVLTQDGQLFVMGMMLIGAVGAALSYAARQWTLLRIKAERGQEDAAPEAAPEANPARV